MTFINALTKSLKLAPTFNPADQIAPVAVIWTDEARQWEPLIPRLIDAGLPILTLGAYDPDRRTGPAIWLRCMVARKLPTVDWPEDTCPIIYLPGISRQNLRAIETTSEELKPIAELQYRSVFWSHSNGRDWTIAGFLQSAQGGLGIPVASDAATKEAMERALPVLADEPIASLQADAPLTAARFNSLLNPEPTRNLLLWLNDPAGRRSAVKSPEWDAFRATCIVEYRFDPDTDGAVTAAQKFGERNGAWKKAWDRYAEAPSRYPGIPDLLRQARPVGNLFMDPSSWPQDNEQSEQDLRDALQSLATRPSSDARTLIAKLESEHGARRSWVWAELGQSPLAMALPALVALSSHTIKPLAGPTPQKIADAYNDAGWRADAAVLDTLASVERAEDVKALKAAVNVLYQPWLAESAENFQQAILAHPIVRTEGVFAGEAASAGRCILFADGLRLDVGKKLAENLRTSRFSVTEAIRFAALPTVTPTAKPAISPASPRLGPGNELNPAVRSDGSKVAIDTLRRELQAIGYQILSADVTGDSTGSAWTEAGSLDAYGHAQGWKIARRITEEVTNLTERVQSLLDDGWAEVVIVTDHGWLLLPGGLPKADLPEHLTEVRKGRCARLKSSATDVSHQIVPWHWDPSVSIAMAPGITCYTAGKEYEHGGLSPQECVVPVITVRKTAARIPPSIHDVKWSRLRCRIQVANASISMSVDLRTKAADPATSLTSGVKALDAAGAASLVVLDESREEEAVLVVVLDAAGTVIAQQATTVGG